jgi:threonine aldolase
MLINLVSDTVTKPTPGMLSAMMSAEVGDDVFREDPTVNKLEEMVAKMFDMEAALFCPSGTMTNQIGIKTHTQPLICDEKSHIFQSEVGGYAFHSAIGVNLLRGENGMLTADMIQAAIKPRYDWLPITSLVVLENTINHAGGSFYRLEQIRPITALCKEKGIKLHLDGARLFNALAETGETTQAVGACFDSISICLSKGLGAPIGSLLIGKSDFISRARRIRKAMGGGMRQAGFLAAAGIYALEHQVDRLKIDNAHARQIGSVLSLLPYVTNLRDVRTNIVIFDVKAPWTGATFLAELTKHNIKAVLFGPNTVRFVTHLEVTEEMVNKLIAVLKQII